MFSTRSHAWREVGLAREVTRQAARRAKAQIILLAPAITAVLLVYSYREDLFGKEWDRPVRIATVVALVILGYAFARGFGRAAAPALFRRMDPGTAGTVGFLIRLGTIGIVLIVALRIAGLEPRTLAVGGAFTAVVFGLAAQQTLGNLIAGTVILSARPFRVGDRVRLEGSGIDVEGIVSSLGLLYVTLAEGDDTIMVPNSIVIAQAVTPLREPDSVDLRARLRAGTKPSDLQQVLEETVTVDTRSAPHIVLEELDGDELVVRISATPIVASEGPRLADEILSTVGRLTGPDASARAPTETHQPAGTQRG